MIVHFDNIFPGDMLVIKDIFQFMTKDIIDTILTLQEKKIEDKDVVDKDIIYNTMQDIYYNLEHGFDTMILPERNLKALFHWLGVLNLAHACLITTSLHLPYTIHVVDRALFDLFYNLNSSLGYI